MGYFENMIITEFKPKPGQIDFTHAKEAPVINCLVKYGDRILIVKRNPKMHFSPALWNGISGFLDDEKSVEEKVAEELREELGLGEEAIISIKIGKILRQHDPKYDKTWIVHTVLVEVNTDKITLDWEAEKYEWILPTEISKYETVLGFDQVIKSFFP